MAPNDDQSETRISLGNGGWVRVDSGTLPGPLYLRLARDSEGRWHTYEVYLEGEGRHVDAADLRNIPLRAFETEILANGGQRWMSAHETILAPDLGTLASYYATSFGRGAERNWVADSFRAQTPDGADLRAPRQIPAEPVTHSPVPPLAAPAEGLTDEFLSHVAAAYRAAVASRKQPGPELAEQAGVPVRTVHRWIYIARQRGFIPPAARKRPMTKQEDLATRPIPAEDGVRRPIATAIVTSDLGVLVGRRNDGTPPWTFIAGEIEPGESPADAASREVKEEAGGLRVQVGDVIGEREHPKTHRRMIYMAAVPTHGTDVFVGDEDELAEVRWVSLAEADELLPGMFEPVREHLARELGRAGDD